MNRSLPPFLLQLLGSGIIVLSAIVWVRTDHVSYTLVSAGLVLAFGGKAYDVVQKLDQARPRRYELPPTAEELRARYRELEARESEVERERRKREEAPLDWDDGP